MTELRADDLDTPDAAPRALTDQPPRNTRNNLLIRMSDRDYALIRDWLVPVTLDVGTILARAGEPIDDIFFLDGGLAGYLDVLTDGRRFAIGIIGREGIVGWPVLMGSDRWPFDVEVRAKCTAVCLPAAELLRAVDGSPSLRDLLLRFAGTFTNQMSRTIVSNLIHSVEQRTARWILLYHDRLETDQIAMTHEELGNMLGVRRASITSALHQLEGANVIKGLRGRIVIRNRAALELLAGETYGFAEAEYRRLIG